MARRYKNLFTLPSIKVTIFLTIITSTLLFIASYFLLYIFDLSTFITLFIFEALILISIIIEQMILRNNPLATFKRLFFISFSTYLIWLLVLVFGLLLSISFSIYYENYTSFLLLGFFYAIAFRLLVIGSIFYENLLKKIFITFFQPIILVSILLPISSFNNMITLYSIPTLGGIAIITSVIFYLIFIDRIGAKLMGVGSLELFRAFLSAWAANNPKFIEDFIDSVSSQEKVRVNVIILNSNNMKVALVVPEVHPGPFYPIGSSNLPFDLQNWFKNNGFSSIIFHGISGHELNLPSKREVDRFISSLKNLKMIASGNTCSIPVIAKVGRATATGIAFGDTVLIMLTLSPFGMEDLPLGLKQNIKDLALKLGYKHVIIIDTHNSQGDIIKEEDCSELIKSAEKLMMDLKLLEQYNFMAGFAHSSELNLNFGKDIGPAGLGVLVLEINNRKFSIVVADSNNCVKGLREELMRSFKDTKAPILELCTSDTHFNAGRTSTPKGYITLGEITSSRDLSEFIRILIDKSLERLALANFQVYYVDTLVKVIGMRVIDTLSNVLDKSLSLVKKGAIIIAILSFLFLFFTVIFV
ncbi:MAG: DUF2070 family protein [Nitrososphaerales archaeon]